MLNEDFVVRQIKPCLNTHNEMNWADFYDLFSGLTKAEQYEVIQITIKHDIDIVDEKEEEVAALAHVKVLQSSKDESSDYRKLLALRNEQLCLLYQQGDKSALEALIEKNKRLVYQVAQKIVKQYTISGLTIDDLFFEGVIGLSNAAGRFKTEFESYFITYAWSYIRQAITRAIMDTGYSIRMPVHVFETMNRIHKIRALNPALSEKDFIELYNREYPLDKPMDAERLRRYLIYEENYMNVASLNTFIGEESDTELLEMIPAPYSLEDDVLENDLRRQLLSLLDELTERERKVIYKRFGIEDGRFRTLEEVSHDFHVTRERIRQIEKKALGRLSKIVKLKQIDYFSD